MLTKTFGDKNPSPSGGGGAIVIDDLLPLFELFVHAPQIHKSFEGSSLKITARIAFTLSS